MSLSITLGIIGILVSIGVGFGTYYLADKQARRNRWQGAKDIVLRDLSKSLGEGSVPEPGVILATVRSVLRSQNAADLAVVTFEEVKDDLLRQVTADPFLDAERRKQLQNQVLNLKTPELPPKPPRGAEREPREGLIDVLSPVALLLGVLASLLASVVVLGVPRLIQFLDQLKSTTQNAGRDWFLFAAPIIAAIATIVATIVSMAARLFRDRSKQRQ